MKTILALLVSLLLGISAAKAQLLIFDNDVSGAPTGAYGADTGNQSIMAGNVFSPLVAGTANHVVFNGLYFNKFSDPLPTDNFTLNLYSATAGAPDAFIDSSGLTNVSRLSVGTVTIFSTVFEVYHFTGDLTTPFNLTLGDSYYLGFENADSPSLNFGLTYSDSGPSTQGYNYAPVVGGFHSAPVPFQFQLSQAAAAPEPSSYLFGIIMLGVLGFEIRRRVLAA